MASEDFKQFDPSELPAQERALYDAMKRAYRVYADAKAEFEGAMQENGGTYALFLHGRGLRPGEELKFGYNFGKLAIAIGPERERKARKETARQSFVDFVAEQKASGRPY